MKKLSALLIAGLLGTGGVAVADIRGEVQIKVKAPTVIIRDTNRPPPRGYVRFDDYRDYDRVDRVQLRYDISGAYDSQFGRVQLTQEGNRVFGTYVTPDGLQGHIKGRIRNGTLYYRWKQPGTEGQGVWYVRDGRQRTIAGTWGTFQSRSNAGNWNLQRVSVSRYDDRDGRRAGWRR